MADNASCDCALVISTCDSYSEIWAPFFTLFHKFWPDNPFPVFVNSETLDCQDENIPITTLKARIGISWTRRLKEALERVDAEYIVFMLDDFFLYDFVNTEHIEECLTYMRNDSAIGAIYFSALGYQMEECDLPGLEKCCHTGKSKVNLTLALWKKETLLHYLNHDETAWEFEANSLERSLERSDTFYSFSKSMPIVVPYDYMKYGLFAGKWFKTTADLFRDNEIEYDFSARGLYEEYEYGLIPYVARQIKMNSYLVPCYSLTKDNPRIDSENIVAEGCFLQTYNVSGAKNAAIWYPSSIPGYSIEDFKCTITFQSGTQKVLGAKDVFGSFSLYHDAMYFLAWGVFVYILPDCKQEMSSITFEGYMNKSLDRDDLAAAYGIDVRVAPIGLKSLIDGSRIYAETLLLSENFGSFRTYSKLCFKYDGVYDEKKAIFDGKDRFPGHFSQSYHIDKSSHHIVRWDVGGSFGGFAMEDLQVEMIYSGGVSCFLDSQDIKGDGVLINGCWVFLSSSAHLLLSLPEDRPDIIKISGTTMAPMPRKVLRAVIYGNDDMDNEVSGPAGENDKKKKSRSSLMNLNGLRFVLSLVNRGVKKYGVFGVVKEAVKRVFIQ